MKFEVKYPTGAHHTVQLRGPLVALGRDPTCDLVLNDAKCSRRHAVVEVDPKGLIIRDTGSANGVFVNGKKVERKRLNPGDAVRLGDVIVEVVEEEVGGTVVMAAEELLDPDGDPAAPVPAPGPTALDTGSAPAGPLRIGGPPPAKPGSRTPFPRIVPSPPAHEQKTETDELAAVRPTGPIPRPLTVTTLAWLWVLALALFGGGGVAAALFAGLPPLVGAAAAAGGLLLAALSGLMALGLWKRAPWARALQIGFAVLGVFICPLTLAAGTTLVYLFGREARIHFTGPRDLCDLSPDEAKAVGEASGEATFTFAILATLVVGLIATAVAAWFAFRSVR